MDRAVTMRAGFVWRQSFDGVVVHPRGGQPFTVDRRSGQVLAVVDRARPAAVAFERLLDTLAPDVDTRPVNAEEWLEGLLVLFESLGLVCIERASTAPDVAGNTP